MRYRIYFWTVMLVPIVALVLAGCGKSKY